MRKNFPKMRMAPTIADALCGGGRTLDVDGVLLIGEHGTYPRNEKGQTLYPRYEFFAQIIDVFRKSGRSVPIFNDKHLSWSWDHAHEMVATSRALGFPLMAGSSLPVTRRLPAIDFPYDAMPTEVMAIGYGGVDSYDFHVLETIQCMVERRRGGETGVAAVQAIRGDDVWTRMKAGSWQAGGWDPDLFRACLCRSIQLGSARAGYSDIYPTEADVRTLVKTPIAYRIEYRDGLKATMLLLNGLVTDMTFAARLRGESECLFVPDVPAASRRVQLLQPARAPGRDDVPHRQEPATDRADPADDGINGGRGRIAVARSTADRDAAPVGRLSGVARIGLLENVMVSRREFLATSGSALALAGPAAGRFRGRTPRKRMRLALIATLWTYQSHAQHIGDRFLVGYPHQGDWHQPEHGRSSRRTSIRSRPAI